MPLSRHPEMAEMVVAMFAPELVGSLLEPPPQRVMFANLIDQMACEGLLVEVNEAMQDVEHPETAVELLNVVANAMEIATEVPRGRIGVSTLFVSPPGFMYWERNFHRFVYLLFEDQSHELCHFRTKLRVNDEDLRPAALSYHRYLTTASGILQSVEHHLTWTTLYSLTLA